MMYDDGGKLYEHTFFVHYYECDSALRLSVIGVLHYLEEIALMQSESLGVGFSYYREQNVAWLLTKWDIRLGAMPSYGSAVAVRTQPRSARGFMANRSFVALGPEGGSCVEADSQWVFVDTARGRPTRLHPAIMERYGARESESTPPWDTDPRPLERTDAHREFTVRQSDIDHNGHVNNIRYVEWALESLPADRMEGLRLVRLLVHYRRETRYGTRVESTVQIDREGETLVGRHEILDRGTVVCRLESHWEE